MKQRTAGSPPLEEKLRYHQMRKDGLCDTWAEYLKLRAKLKTTTATRPVQPVDTVSIGDYEPDKTPQDELGF